MVGTGLPDHDMIEDLDADDPRLGLLADQVARVRELAPRTPLLVPGVDEALGRWRGVVQHLRGGGIGEIEQAPGQPELDGSVGAEGECTGQYFGGSGMTTNSESPYSSSFGR